MRQPLRFAIALLVPLLGLACSRPSQEEPTNLKQIQQQRSGDYLVTLLSDTGLAKQGENSLVLEFRNASSNQLVDVSNVQAESMMEMAGAGPMKAGASVTPGGTPGRFNVTTNLAMAGQWGLAVTFDTGQRVEFRINAQ